MSNDCCFSYVDTQVLDPREVSLLSSLVNAALAVAAAVAAAAVACAVAARFIEDCVRQRVLKRLKA